jgi:hypothetical protein
MKIVTAFVALTTLLGTASCAQSVGDESREAGAQRSAATPPLPSGRPDLSGVWRLRATTDPGLIGLPMGPEMFNIGASLANGLPYRSWAEATVAAQRADGRANDPLSHCLPIGLVRAHTITFYREVVQLPDQVLLLSEHNAEFRRVYTDGRPVPTDVPPKVNGYSSGRWEGDALVVETTGFRDGAVWLDGFGSPLTDAAKITERFRRPSFDSLAIELTVEDPKAYTESWTVMLTQELVEGVDLEESFCAEEQLVELVSRARK